MSLYDDFDELKDMLIAYDKDHSTDYSKLFARIENSHADLERETMRLSKLAAPVLALKQILRED